MARTSGRTPDIWRGVRSTPSVFDELFNDIFESFNRSLTNRGRGSSAFGGGIIVPQADMQETDDAYFLTVEMPGVNKNDINIEVSENVLTIRGQRKSRFFADQADNDVEGYQEMTFERSFRLPSTVDENQIEASCENGVLEIVMPKSEQSKPRSIQIGERSGLIGRLLGKKGGAQQQQSDQQRSESKKH